jgi:phage terminase large subunit GpA-like protein
MSFNPIGRQFYVYCPFCGEQFIFNSTEDTAVKMCHDFVGFDANGCIFQKDVNLTGGVK